jgi:hypothetical protein
VNAWGIRWLNEVSPAAVGAGAAWAFAMGGMEVTDGGLFFSLRDGNRLAGRSRGAASDVPGR